MSDLDVPRLHFPGKFSADPSTIKNDPANDGRSSVILEAINLPVSDPAHIARDP